MRLVPAVVASLALVSSSPAQTVPAQTPAAYRYEFRLEAHGDSGVRAQRGTVRVSGSRARVDLDSAVSGRNRGYYLLADSGRTVYAVHPDRREYAQYDAGEFAHELGRGNRIKARVIKFTTRDTQVDSARLGAGEPVAGHATQRVQLNTRWKVRVRLLLAKSDMPCNSDAQYWSDPDMPLMRNPMLELMSAQMLPLAGGDEEFWDEINTVRGRLFPGSPFKADLHTTIVDSKGEKSYALRYAVTTVTLGPQNEGDLELPAGYRKSKVRSPRI